MAIKFTKTNEKEQSFKSMNARFDATMDSVRPYADETTLSEISGLKNNFNRRIEDFFRNDRKLNLAVIGRVKAGKSTFLNMLIFDGKDVLPRAFTPKTATLTKIEYAPEDAMRWSITQQQNGKALMNLPKAIPQPKKLWQRKNLSKP